MSLNNSIIYSFGGYNTKRRYLNVVEKYLIDEDKWIFGPSLLLERQDVSACLVNNLVIYLFGGAVYDQNNWMYLSNIERLNTSQEQSGWESLQVINNNGWSARVFACVRQISPNEIIIFGGFNGNHSIDTLIFNFETMSIVNANIKLRRMCSFIQRNSVIIENNEYLYAVGFPYIDIHRYSFAEKDWKYLDSKKMVQF